MLQISVPTLLLDREKVLRNISRMSAKAVKAGCDFRPHFKTHQSVTIGDWFREYQTEKIAVSSLSMAGKFAVAGWKDIMVAIPVNINQTGEINALAGVVRLGITVECDITVAMLRREIRQELDLYIEMDTGYHRSGIDWQDYDMIDKTISQIANSEFFTFRGFVIHAGETYQVSGQDKQSRKGEILRIHRSNMEKLQLIKERYEKDYPDLVISYGDTPGCSLAEDYGVVTELRPGNFVFYDLMMCHLGVCEVDDIAVAMACPVIGIYPKRQELVIYGGAVHFSKDFIEENGQKIFGQQVQSSSLGWGGLIDGVYVRSLSQEHGIIRVDNPAVFRRIGIGDMLTILPVHSCLTADSMGAYQCLDGEKISI